MKAVTFVEIDIDRCTLVYGVAPCTAAINVTGARKCYNTLATCQDPTNYDPAPVTVRFAVASDYLNEVDQGNLPAIPSVISVDHTPGRIRIAEDLGERASVRVTFVDHPDADITQDPYISERPNPPGTFWGRFRARHQYLLGRPLRWIDGVVGQAIADMDARHYIIESIEGPDMSGRLVIVAKDALKLADGTRAQAPRLSQGRLSAAITNTDVSVTLSPAGIGDLEYPASGKAAINDEIVSFTRSGDTLTLTRAQSFTEASGHDADDRVQLVLVYSAQPAGSIITDLLETYANVPSGLIDIKSDSPFNFAAEIAEPTSVRQLVSELMEQASISIFFDELRNKIVYRDLRSFVEPSANLTQDLILADSFAWRDQPDRRVSQVWTYYGQRNPLVKIDEQSNYAIIQLEVDLAAESADQYGQAAIKQIYSRWIGKENTPAAIDVGNVTLTRFRNIPRLFNWSLQASTVIPRLGDTISVSVPAIQNDAGAQAVVPASIVSRGDAWSGFVYEAEEFRLTPRDPSDPQTFTVTDPDSTQANRNLRQLYDESGLEATAVTVATFVVPTGTVIGGFDKAATISTGDWPAGASITLIIDGQVVGRGGDGGDGDGGAGEAGQAAILATYAIEIENNGTIAGGGGGGGAGGFILDLDAGIVFPGGGGGGGQGLQGGQGGAGGVGVASASSGQNGSLNSPGAGGDGVVPGISGGSGGALATVGDAGEPGDFTGGAGGAAGDAIVGSTFVTLTGSGTIIGAQV